MLQVEGFIQGTFDLIKNLPEEFAELPGDVSGLVSSAHFCASLVQFSNL